MKDTMTTCLPEATFMPRPPNTKIGDGIIGQGVIATEFISSGHQFGLTHIFTNCLHARRAYPDGWIRVGVGSSYNQALLPVHVNCRTIHHGDREHPQPGDRKEIVTIRDIQPGEELCVAAYTLYTPVAPLI
jgi:hypothetical protein